MKKKILLLMGVFSLGLLQAQVGINTTSPANLFHLNPTGDNNATDDIVMTQDGRMGIGTHTPTAKVDVRSTTVGAFQVESSNSTGQAMQSNINGVGSWGPIPGTWYAVLEDGTSNAASVIGNLLSISFTGSYLSSNINGATVTPNIGQVRIPFTGAYRITIMGLAQITRTIPISSMGYFVTHLAMRVGTTDPVNAPRIAWGPHQPNHIDNGVMTFGFVSIQSLRANELVRILNTNTAADILTDVTFVIEFIS